MVLAPPDRPAQRVGDGGGLVAVVAGVEVVNMYAGSEVVMGGDVLVDCGAAWEMEVWPSRVVLRKKALNRREGHWLKTVVLNVVGKGAT